MIYTYLLWHEGTRISTKLIDQICELIRQRIKTRDLCEVVGINYGTYHSWLNRGRKESEGHYHDLVVKIAESEDEVYDDLKQVVFNAALKGSKEYQRVTKLSKTSKV